MQVSFEAGKDTAAELMEEELVSGDYKYVVSDEGATITGYTGAGGAVVIPEVWDGNTVISIRREAFAGNAVLTHVTLPDTLTKIGNDAFYNCTALTSVTIPASIQSVERSYPYHGPFEGCSKLDPVNPFEDVREDTYYYSPVLWAVNHQPQITNGTSPVTFSSDATCTRAQVVTFLWRAMGQPEPASAKNPFKDVSSDAYYYKAVLWAVEKKITAGTSDSTFSPNDPCTRGQVATFLHRTQGEPAVNAANPFRDLNTKGFYYQAVLWAVANEITNGTSKTTFSPNATCTRGQIVTFLYRALQS